MSVVHVGLIGFGAAGRVFHAPVIRAVPGLRLSAIVQRSGDTASAAYPDVAVVRSVEDLLAIDGVRLVVVATPTVSHAAIARRCLEAGRDVVVDKPFAASSREAAELVDVAARAGRLLTVFHNRRWDGDFLTLRRLVDEGACGRIVLFESHFDRFRVQPKPGSWRERAQPGSGLLFDLGSHLVDQALELFGLPERVTADIRIERDGVEADDAFDVVLHYPRMRALLRATMLAAEPGPRFVLRGTAGTFVKHGLDPQEEALRRGDALADPAWGEEPRDRWGTLTRPGPAGGMIGSSIPTQAGDYRRFYENVRDAVLGQAALDVTPQQAVEVVRLLEIAVESSRQGCSLKTES